MVDLNDNLLAIVQKAKEDEIQKRVYDQIKRDIGHLKIFGAVGALIVLVVATFHSQILTAVVTNFGEGLRETIKQDTKVSTEALKASEARVQAVSETIMATSHSYLDELIKKEGEVARTKDNLASQLNQLEEELKKLDSAKERIAQAQSDAQVAIDQLKRYRPLFHDLISNQDSVISTLNKSKDFQLAKAVKTINESLIPASAERQGIVYLQFAGFERSIVQEISQRLTSDGWTIPGEVRTSSAAHTNDEVRYNIKDKERAKALTDDANKALRELNLSVKLTAIQNELAKPGILEIWIHQK